MLARPLQVGNGLRVEARFRVVMGQQLGLCLTELRKAFLEHLGNALMVLLSGALEQGLIGSFLDQRMLEDVRGGFSNPQLG